MSQSVSSAPITLGFLTVLQDNSGWVGGYLVTNGWGRPLEFRLTTAVQPNRLQTTLYGPTLTEYLLTDLIGKTLVEKTPTKPELLIADLTEMLALRSRLETPIAALKTGTHPPDAHSLQHARSSVGLLVPGRFAADVPVVTELLDRVDASVDLVEPFERIREAIAEARKMGVANRAA